MIIMSRNNFENFKTKVFLLIWKIDTTVLINKKRGNNL